MDEFCILISINKQNYINLQFPVQLGVSYIFTVIIIQSMF